nr:translational activator gcn1 [Hymenolepis microstoma]
MGFQNIEKFLPLASLACTLQRDSDVVKSIDKSKTLATLLEYAFAEKKPASLSVLASIDTINAFIVFQVILSRLEFQIDEIEGDLIDTLISNLLSSNSKTRNATVSSLVSLVKLSKNPDLKFIIFKKVSAKLNGPEGRRSSADVNLSLLDALGSLSQPPSTNTCFYPDVLKSFLDIITSEGNEDILDSAIKQLSRWMNLPKFTFNEKAQTLFKDKLFANQTSHRVKMVIFRFLDEVCRSTGKLPKAYIPLLATTAQSAKKEPPASDAVSRALAAACLWLMNTSQPGKLPDATWNVLGDLKVTQSTSQDALPNWLKDRFLLRASPHVHSYLISCIYILFTNHSNMLSNEQKNTFYRVLMLLWLYTDSPEVLADLRCCMFSTLANERKHDNTITHKVIIDTLNPLVMESLDKKGDLLSAALDMHQSRFGRRLIQLVSLIATVGSCTSLKFKTSVFANSRLPAFSEESILKELSISEKLSLFCAALCGVSHPATIEIEKRPWLHLLKIIGLPQQDSGIKNVLSGKDCIESFNKVVDRLLKLPKLDAAHRLMLQRLIQWSPIKFPSCLASKLSLELSRDEFLRVTTDEVGIMTSEPGRLYNQALLDNFPRYQTNKANVKKENKLYSLDIQLDIMEAQKQKQEKEAKEKEADFLTLLATQLTATQMDIVKAEMANEAEIRTRVSKIFSQGSHMMDILTVLNDTLLHWKPEDHSIRLEFLIQNASNLWNVLASHLQKPLLSVLAIGAHSRLGQLMAEVAISHSVKNAMVRRQKARCYAAWTIRILSPCRVMLKDNTPPTPSYLFASFADEACIYAENAEWDSICHAHSVKHQTEAINEMLIKEVEKRDAAGGVIVSATIPVFDQILSFHTNFVFDPENMEDGEDENKRWAMCQHHGNFLLAIWKHVRMSDDIADTMETNSQLCKSLEFENIYKFLLHLIEKHCLAVELNLISPTNKNDENLSAFANDVFQSAIKLHISFLLYHLKCNQDNMETLLISLTPVLYFLMDRLVAKTHFCRSSTLTAMINFANHFPDLFTLPFSPQATTTTTPSAENNENEELAEEQLQSSEADAASTTTANKITKSAGGNLNKAQKKKKKRAALQADATKALGDGFLKMDKSIVDPASWPTLSVIANSQLRLFISRCDPFLEVAIDSDRLWSTVGFEENCESSEVVDTVSSEENENGGENDAQKKLKRFTLLTHPKNPHTLPSAALATRLLLECLQKAPDVQQAAASALQRCLNGKPQESINHVLDYWLNIYYCLIEKPQAKTDVHGKPIKQVPPKYTQQRVGMARALEAVVSCSRTPGYYLASDRENLPPAIDNVANQQPPSKAGAWLGKIFQFLVDEGLHDPQEEVRCALLRAGLAATQNYGVTNLQQLLTILEAFLNKAPNVAELDMVRQSVVVLLGSLAKFLEKDDPRVMSIFNKLLSAVSFPADVVQKAVEDALAPLAPKIPAEQLEKVFPRLMSTLFSSLSYPERRGAAYALAGIIHGIGISALKQRGIIDRLLASLDDKNAKFRESSLFAFERLSLALGRLFEPYIVKVIPQLLSCFGDTNAGVRDAASVTSRAVMSKLSAHGIKLILPILLKVIDEENPWRTKCQAVEVLGTMTSCAPKQLSACLPQIVPRILKVLVDSQESLKKAGAQALERIGTVIRNPEVQALVPCLIKSLHDPLTDKGVCLLTLRDTCFTHVVDAASLALIMPVLHRAFNDRSTLIRKAAAQIFGTLYSLARREDLEPYIDEVLPGLRACLLDPVPEVRSITARALGAMVRGIGEACSKDLLPWLMRTLTSDQSSVDRSGAAQGLAEVLGGMGLARLQSILPEFIHSAENPAVQPHARDGYLMLFIYLPEVFRNDFSPFVTMVLSPILKAFADECEYLRDTALKAGQRIIDLFADQAVEILLPELEKGLLSTDWRIRYSSLQLISDLLCKLSGISGKGTTKTMDEDDTFGTDIANEKIIQALGLDRRNRVLARLHIARSDPTYTVRNAASHVWKIVVVNTPRTLRELMPVLVEILLSTLGSTLREHQQVACRALGDLVKKLGERVLPEVIPHLEEGLNSPDDNRRRGVCNGLIEIMFNCQSEQIAQFSDRFTSPIRRSLTDSSVEVRTAGARAFDLLYSGIHLRAVDEILPDLFLKLEEPQSHDYALDGIRQILALRGRAVMPYLIPRLTQPKLDAKTFAFLAPIAGDSLTRHLNRILPAFLETAARVDVADKENSDLKACSVILASISDVSAVRSILQELINGLSLNDSTDTQMDFTSLKPNSQKYCYACLRILHVYMEAFLVDEVEEEQQVVSIVKPVRRGARKLPGANLNDESDSGDEDEDTEDYSDDDISNSDEEGENDIMSDESDDDSDNFIGMHYRERNSKEALRRLLPDYYPPLLRNISKLLAMKDLPLMTYAWVCLEAILKYWSANNVTGANVSELQKALKAATVDFVSNQMRMRRERAQEMTTGKEVLLPGFAETKMPLPSLVRFYADCIMQGNPDTKEPAAQGLTECVTLSSGEAIKPCVVKVLGPMIRLLGERQPTIVRAAVTESLATLVEKCPDSTRPFSPQLLATFTKVLGDPIKEIRLVGGKGLANVLANSPKLDSVLVDICVVLAAVCNVTIDNPPPVRSLGLQQQPLNAASVNADTVLQCLRNCLSKSLGKPKLDTLRIVIDYMIPLGRKVDGLSSTKLDKDVDLVDVRKSANACLGAAIASASANAAITEEDLLKLMPWCETSDSDSPVFLQAHAQAIMVAFLISPASMLQSKFETVFEKSRSIVVRCCDNADKDVRSAGFRALGFLINAALMVSNNSEEKLLSLVKVVEKALKQGGPNDKIILSNVICCIGSRISLRNVLKTKGSTSSSWIPQLLTALCTTSKDKITDVCVAVENAIIALCQLGISNAEKNDITNAIGSQMTAKDKALFEETLSRINKRGVNAIFAQETRMIDDTEIYLPPLYNSIF